MFRRIITAFALLFALGAAGALAAQIIDLDKPDTTQTKPEIWQKASEAAVKAAEEAARKDACARLVEKVYTLPVSGNRDVLDMMIKNADVDKALIKALGATPAVSGEYLADGTVRVRVITTPQLVRDILKKAYANVDWDLAEEDSVITAVAVQTKADQQIIAEGEGALAGSVGEKRIPVRRAALLKAKTEFADQVRNFVIREDWEWRRERVLMNAFIADFKQIPRKLALGVADTRIMGETWAPDGSVEMRVELDAIKPVQVLQRAQSLYDERRKWADYGSFSSLTAATKDRILSAEVKANSRDKAPPDTPLALETEAVDQAMKLPVKNLAPGGPNRS